jgi:Nitrile hydratase, alpha chain
LPEYPNPHRVRGLTELDRIAGRALAEPEFREQLLRDPKRVLRDAGLRIPDEVDVVVHENTPETIHIVLPAELVPEDSLENQEVDLRLIVATHF